MHVSRSTPGVAWGWEGDLTDENVGGVQGKDVLEVGRSSNMASWRLV